jgi:transcription elongation factor
MKKAALPQPTKRNSSKAAVAPAVGFRPALGQTVQVTSGQLAGMKGIVVDAANAARCKVQLYGVTQGVLLAIDPKWLRRAPRPRS